MNTYLYIMELIFIKILGKLVCDKLYRKKFADMFSYGEFFRSFFLIANTELHLVKFEILSFSRDQFFMFSLFYDTSVDDNGYAVSIPNG